MPKRPSDASLKKKPKTMSEQLRRIMRLVQEGKLSADDAMDLVDAIHSGQPVTEPTSTPPPPPTEPEAMGAGDVPPPPPGEKAQPESDPFKAALDALDKIGKEIATSVDWKDVSAQIRTGAKRGFEAIRDAAKDLAEGKFNLNFLGSVASRTQELPLAPTPGKTIRIENPSGSIRVIGRAPLGKIVGVAQVQAASQAEAEERIEGFQLSVVESDAFVDIKPSEIPSLVTDLTVHLSEDAKLEIRSRSGNVTVEQMGGGLRVAGTSGDVRISQCQGALELSTSSGQMTLTDIDSTSTTIENKCGDIAITAFQGELNVRSASGDIKVDEFRGRSIALEAVSGDINLVGASPFEGNMTLRTVSGDARVHLPQGSSAKVTLSTLSGDVTSELELTEQENQHRRITGVLGSGTGAIDISAVAGDIHVSTVKVAAATS